MRIEALGETLHTVIVHYIHRGVDGDATPHAFTQSFQTNDLSFVPDETALCPKHNAVGFLDTQHPQSVVVAP